MLFLTTEELATLTGRVRFSAQVKVLKELGIPYTLSAAGRPVVVRRFVEERNQPQRKKALPNLEVW